MLKKHLKLVPFPCGAGAKVTSCAEGPKALKEWNLSGKLSAEWADFPPSIPQTDAMSLVTHYCRQLQLGVQAAVAEDAIPITIGGDHSMAIGTWSGITAECGAKQKFGLIWVDAHLDAHTRESSPSDAIHGMPISYLLGYGSDELSKISGSASLAPQHMCMIGIRSYEEAEHEFLARLGVRIVYMDEIEKHGLKVIMQQAMEIATSGTSGFGITVDLDGLDPKDAPAVGTPEAGGIRAQELLPALGGLGTHPLFKGLEIAEYNPTLDINFQTAELVRDIIESIITPPSS